MRAYNLKAIKIEPAGGGEGINPTTHNVGLGSIDSISDLFNLVKTFDKDFYAGKSVNPLLLNDDGMPKVVYHGSNTDFTVFESKGCTARRISGTAAGRESQQKSFR